MYFILLIFPAQNLSKLATGTLRAEDAYFFHFIRLKQFKVHLVAYFTLLRAQATFQEAWGFCCGFDMKLLAVDSSQKHACLTKLSKSKFGF
jgi:hypothetical protein